MAKFVKGQSGNPAGKPKGAIGLMLTPTLRAVLGEPHPDFPGMTHRDVVVARLVSMAATGDLEAIKILFDRVDGKVMQPVEHAGEGGGALRVLVEYVDRPIGGEP